MLRPTVAVLVLLGLAASAGAAGVIFRWVDAKGDMHVTDRLGDVPEPYHSMYQAELRRLAEAKGKGKSKGKVTPRQTPSPRPSAESAPTPRPSTESAPSIVEQEIARQKYWRDLVAQWRSSLGTATDDLDKIDQQLAQARLNPLLRTTPPVKAKIAQLEKDRAVVLQKVEAARTMLLTIIPERARKEHVPPKWLM